VAAECGCCGAHKRKRLCSLDGDEMHFRARKNLAANEKNIFLHRMKISGRRYSRLATQKKLSRDEKVHRRVSNKNTARIRTPKKKRKRIL
jgi:hypothetical protein